MKPVHTFIARPALPVRLERLRALAYNLRWAWNHSTIALFRRLDADLWEATNHNPVLLLGMIEQEKLEAAARDDGFLSHLEGTYQSMQEYMNSQTTWFHRIQSTCPGKDPMVAYFSLEFGVTECLSIFAGGLGVLAGDHLKSASDLGVPLVGVGLLYQQGYFTQYLNESGWQQEAYVENDFHNMPILLEHQPDGSPVRIQMDFPGRLLTAQVWKAQVGRVALYLLDTNVPENQPADRDITDQLYGGDIEMRIKQEILLGIGGFRALETLGLQPNIYHMNEGHSAFLALERSRRLMEKYDLNFAEAREATSLGMVFTTHTPVPAGHDRFPPQLMERYFADYMGKLGLSSYDFLALGRQDPQNQDEPFCMTVLALRMASYSNGVSRLHGEVSRKMWQGLWPNVPQDEVPISHVTNGVHFRSWISAEMDQLYLRYLGHRWQEEPGDPMAWRADQIPAEELWRTHERRRQRLVAYTRQKLHQQMKARGASQADLEVAEEVLDSEALTIGFARRFATYKRATLILSDPDRLDRILNNPERPVQIVFAGKAHPQAHPGKQLIQRIVELARQERFRRRLVFLENYDMSVARYLVQGTDIWLNNPLRPHEASGTSGMKSTANGVLNLSTLDGWWDEAYDPEAGWSIGRGEAYEDTNYQWSVEADALYDLLEREVVPLFYDRGADGLPRRWITRMKNSLHSLCYFFNTHRMVGEYTTRFYLPACAHFQKISQDEMARARELAYWKKVLGETWAQVKVEKFDVGCVREIQVGEAFCVKAWVHLGTLNPDDVSVELYIGRIDARDEISSGKAVSMKPVSKEGSVYLYENADVTCKESGMHGFTIRILPHHEDLATPFIPGLITWA